MRRLIGTGTTDANGQVTVEYTGSGAGKVQLMAECGNIQSETYTLYDVLFKDIGTEDDYTAWTSDANIEIERTTAWTTLTPTDPTAFAARYLTISSYTVPFDIEFDLALTFNLGANSALVSIRQGSTTKASYTPNKLGLVSGKWVHVHLKITDEELIASVDGETKTPEEHDGVFNRFYIGIPTNTGSTIQYRNFVIY